jgi:deoxyribodipyrimidine photolyase-related protein
MAKTVLVLGDQLSKDYINALGTDSNLDTVLMIEDWSLVERKPYHRKKIALVWSAMRHFRDDLKEAGYTVDYRINASIVDCIEQSSKPVFCIEPREHGIRTILLNSGVSFVADPYWYTSKGDFSNWMNSRTQPRLEQYYRMVRLQTGNLMDGEKPVGGVWNFDKENRKPFPKSHQAILQPHFVPDAITEDVMTIVAQIPNLTGDLKNFSEPVTRDAALERLSWFVEEALPDFGRYEDAMSAHDMYGFHSILSPALNLSLISPAECIDAAVKAYEANAAPLASVEAFARQVLGWREYMYHLYDWLGSAAWDEHNALHATEPLPDFYWNGETQMRCLRTTISDTLRTGYAHHIIRLMVQGNFSLLLGVKPTEIRDWFWATFLDAYDWVVTPNVIGMSQAADNGLTASKPYAASGAYINRMSDYCKGCQYEPKVFAGEDACPFTTLYWDFLIRHEKTPLATTRLSTNYLALRGKTQADRDAIAARREQLKQLMASHQL